MPTCSHCGQTKPTTAFRRDRRRDPSYHRPDCNQCRSTINGEGRIRRRRVLRRRINDYLRAHPCVDCGETDILVLEFDHRTRHMKEAPIATMVAQANAWARIEKEIAKCDVRCANCHRRRTHKQLGWHARSGK